PPLRYRWGGRPVDVVDAVPVYYVMRAAAVLVYMLLLALERSPVGTALRAVRDNEQRTMYFGFDIPVYKTFSFVVSAAVAGLAGALFATQFGFVSPALIGVPLSTEVLIWTALGGRDVLLAAFLGALVVRSVESALSEALAYYWLLALGALFVTSVVVFPRGLLGGPLSLPLTRRMRVPRDGEETRAARVPIVVGGDDSILFAAAAGFHDAVDGTVAIVHFDAHLDLLDESPRQGRYSHSSGMRRALELPRVVPRHSVQIG